MASEVDLDLAKQWGEHLAALPEASREQARAAARQSAMLAMPEEELEKVGRPPVRTLGEFLDEELPIPPILVEPGLVARGGITAMSARGGKGKTTLSFNRILRWACGKPLFDELPEVMAPTQPLRTLIIENEGAGWFTQEILQTMLGALIEPEHHEQVRKNVHIWGDGGWSSMKLDKPENIELVKRGVEACEPDIVFLEPFRGLWTGNENDSTEMANVFDAFHSIANNGQCAIMITHHDKKGNLEAGQDPMDAARGSGVFSDLGAVVESYRPVGNDQKEWKLTKSRWRQPPAPVRMQYDNELRGYRMVAENESQRRAVEAIARCGIGAELSVAEAAAELDETQATVRRWLNAACEGDEPRLRKRNVQRDGSRSWYYRLADTPDEDDPNNALGL